jgi:S-formylglutathione hydrolase FrmB
LLLGGTILAQTTSAPTSRGRRARPQFSSADLAGSIEHGTVETKLLPARAEYGVYLPPGYHDVRNASKRYPIVFFLHGLWEDADRWFGRGGARMFDAAIQDGKLPPLIVLVPNAEMSFYSDSLDGKTPYARFFIEELVPWADAKFRTTGKREQRLIAGNSMGGFGALKFAFNHPELFAAVGVHSPAILPENPADASPRARRTMKFLQSRGVLKSLFGDPIDLEKWKAANPLALANTAKLEPPIGIYVDCGDQDEYEFDEGCRTLDEILTRRKIAHEFAIRPGDHGWAYIQASMPFLFKFLDTQLKSSKS